MSEVKTAVKFGTDGWRGIIGEDYTYENVRVAAQAVADFLGKGKKAAVGYDTRFMSGRFAEAAAAVLKANGISVILSDRSIPTPTLSFTVKNRRLDLGIMITASHNPAEYNGFKIKTSTGGAAAPELTRHVESLLGKNKVRLPKVKEGIKKDDFTADYVRFCRSYIDFKIIKNKYFKVLVDAMYGSGDSFMGEILKGSRMQPEFMRHTPNPSFGGKHPEPIEQNLEELKLRVKKERFDLGVALDGDADRIAAVAKGGVYINPQKILCLLALHLYEDRKWSGGIVKTLPGTNMVDNIARHYGIKLYETPVGFKYISNLMETEDILVGGEEAGGMGVKGYIPERDGTVAGLLLLEMMSYRDKDILSILNEAEKRFGRYFYLREDLHVHKIMKFDRSEFPGKILGKKVIEIKDHDGIKLICEDDCWLMVRGSGTEPMVRVYAESRSLEQSRRLISFGTKIVSDKEKTG
ncbi:MAG: phosphoglucomutase/phosphomannomutase family protein [Candidatus Omnitrophica bacterium]|nr:phosphoglucomutase/phosphomannomutase family protein [Candidatus Omnitrophota bacterium]